MPTADTFERQRRAALFEEHRARLVRIAYRMLGTVADVHDVLDEARRRWSAGGVGDLLDPSITLTRIVTRLALRRLEDLRVERQGYAGTWLPEPVAAGWCGDEDGAPGTERSLSLQLLLALESLSPLERAAYVLRVAVADPYPEVAAALGRREPAVRQLVHRARTRLARTGLRLDADYSGDEVVICRLAAACRSASPAVLARVLGPDVVLHTDDPRPAATGSGVTVGRDGTARVILAVLRRLPRGAVLDVHRFNGATGVVACAHGEPVCALAVRVEADLVVSVQLVATAAKLHALRVRTQQTAIE